MTSNPLKKPSYVYFVQAGEGGNIKIGVTGNPAGRFISIQTGASERLAVLLVMRGDRMVEASFHRELSAHRAHGEWYRPHADVLAVVAREKPKAVEYLIPRAARPSKHPLETWRKARQLTAAAFAQKAGTTQATISRIECQTQFPGWELLQSIFEATDGAITPNDFAPWLRPAKSEVA